MKKLTLIIVFTSILLAFLPTKSHSKNPVYLGVPVITGFNLGTGFGYASCDFSPSLNAENLNKSGFFLSLSLHGTFLVVPLHKAGVDFSVSLSPGVGFAQKGTKDKIDLGFGDVIIETSYNSFDGHLYLRPQLSLPGNINVFSLFGMYAGNVFSPEREVSGSLSEVQYSYLNDIPEDDFNNFDGGLLYGVGMRIVFVIVEMRQYHGLTDVINYPTLVTREDRWGRNRFTTLSLGFVF